MGDGARPLPAFLLVPRDNLQYYKWTIGSGMIVRLTNTRRRITILLRPIDSKVELHFGTKFCYRYSKKFSLKIEPVNSTRVAKISNLDSQKFRQMEFYFFWPVLSCLLNPWRCHNQKQSEARSLFFFFKNLERFEKGEIPGTRLLFLYSQGPRTLEEDGKGEDRFPASTNKTIGQLSYDRVRLLETEEKVTSRGRKEEGRRDGGSEFDEQRASIFGTP